MMLLRIAGVMELKALFACKGQIGQAVDRGAPPAVDPLLASSYDDVYSGHRLTGRLARQRRQTAEIRPSFRTANRSFGSLTIRCARSVG